MHLLMYTACTILKYFLAAIMCEWHDQYWAAKIKIQWATPFPLKMAPSHVGMWTPI